MDTSMEFEACLNRLQLPERMNRGYRGLPWRSRPIELRENCPTYPRPLIHPPSSLDSPLPLSVPHPPFIRTSVIPISSLVPVALRMWARINGSPNCASRWAFSSLRYLS